MYDHSKYIRKEYKISEIAYLAGIIDGEGSIYIGNFSCHPKTKVPYYQTNIQVTNTDKPLIDWLQYIFGGLVNKRTKKQHASNSRKQAYMWTASGERLTHLCELLLPFLICKRKQAEIMLEIRATFEAKRGTVKGDNRKVYITEDTLITRQRLMDEMRSLHIRTHSYKNHGHLPRVTIPEKG